jgi:hypothetical protein
MIRQYFFHTLRVLLVLMQVIFFHSAGAMERDSGAAGPSAAQAGGHWNNLFDILDSTMPPLPRPDDLFSSLVQDRDRLISVVAKCIRPIVAAEQTGDVCGDRDSEVLFRYIPKVLDDMNSIIGKYSSNEGASGSQASLPVAKQSLEEDDAAFAMKLIYRADFLSYMFSPFGK